MNMLRSESPSSKCTKIHTVAASNKRSLHYCLFAPHTYGCYSSRTSRSWWITHWTQRQWRGCNNIPTFLQRTAPITHSFCKGCTWHDLHVFVTATFCCNCKAWAANAQSFTLWQQATTEITLLLLVRATYIRMLFFVHIPFMVNRTFNSTPIKRLEQMHSMLVLQWNICITYVSSVLTSLSVITVISTVFKFHSGIIGLGQNKTNMCK